MIETLGLILRDLFAIVGMLTVPVLIGRALLMRGRRSVTMAGRTQPLMAGRPRTDAPRFVGAETLARRMGWTKTAGRKCD